MFKDRITSIARAGKAYLVLYILLGTSIVALVIDAWFDIKSDQRVLQLIGVLALTMMGELLYLWLKERSTQGGEDNPAHAGITGALAQLGGSRFRQVMSRPGKKWIVNTWIFNFSELVTPLKDALAYESTTIEITILKPGNHATQRAAELDFDVKSQIESSLNQLATFLKGLSKSQQSRVCVYEFDATPKFTIYGCQDTAFVGFFWPNLYAALGPQLIVEGETGSFASHVRQYYSWLEKNRHDITKGLLARDAQGIRESSA